MFHDHVSGEFEGRKGKLRLSKVTQDDWTALLDERCCHATEITAEAEMRVANARRMDDAVSRFSRAMGPTLFLFCILGCGWGAVALAR